MNDPELDVLLLKNFQELDQAKDQLDELETRIFAQIDEAVSKWASQEGWVCECEYDDRSDYWIAPVAWRQQGDQFYLYFQLDYEPPNAAEGNFDLSDLCVTRERALVWRLVSDTLKRPELRKAANADEAARKLVLRSWPFRVELAVLQAGAEDGDFRPAFEPIRAQLDLMKKAAPQLDAFVKHLSKPQRRESA